MLDKFLLYINGRNLIDNGQKVLLAVSGGLDSMVMVDVFLKAQFPIGIAHINHKLRGVESDDDQNFVANFCAKHQIPFYLLELPENTFDKGNLQDKARNLRYEWLQDIALQHKYDLIATAHHSSDEVETFMINLMRGAGLSGLDGIPVRSGNIIRPLLFASKEDILQYAMDHAVPYREDSSNATDKYLRNKIRHNVLPVLYATDVRSKSGILKSINNLQQTENLLTFLLKQYTDEIVIVRNGLTEISLEPIVSSEVGPSLLFEIIKQFGYNKEQCHDILNSFAINGNRYLTTEHEAITHRKKLIIRKFKEIPKFQPIKIESFPLEFLWYNHLFRLEIIDVPTDLLGNSNVFYLSDDIESPVVIRQRDIEDKIMPLGMRGRSQKLSDYLNNRKMSLFEKEEVLVIESNGAIIAVLMAGISDRARIDHDAKTCIKITKTPAVGED